MFKKMLTLLFAVLFVVPFAVTADDFDDDFGGFEEDGEEAEESEESGEEEDEEAPSNSKVKEKSESDAAMRDLMGEPEEKSAPKKAKSAGKNSEPEGATEEAAESSAPALKGLKPVMLVKGSFTVFGQYKEWTGAGTKTMQSMFGGVDEGLLGLEYMGKHVIAKGTVNLRTDNALIKEAVHNPLMEENLHSIQNGAANALYEIYGGVKFFDVFIKAGKMIPEYGLIDTYQELGMGFATPFLTRSLIVVEGFVPETDAGLSLGYNSVFAKDHNFFIGLTLGTGSNKSEFWYSDKTMGLYGRIGYGFKEYIKAAVAFQYRSDFSTVLEKGKTVDMIGIGVHLKAAVAGFEMPISFDYNMMNMLSSTTQKKKSTTGMLLSAAPGYAYHFKHEWVDKVSVAVRFDLAQGVYISKNANYLDSTNFRSQGMYFRIGATANFFTKELAGIRAMAGFTFLMQPESKVGNNTYNENGRKKDYGFTTVVLQAGAEF